MNRNTTYPNHTKYFRLSRRFTGTAVEWRGSARGGSKDET